MNLALIQSRLAVTERHIAESRNQIARQELIVGDFADTRRNSLTAMVGDAPLFVE